MKRMINMEGLKNQFQTDEAKEELLSILHTVSVWTLSNMRDDRKISEFIFYEQTHPHIRENFFKVTDIMRNIGLKCSGYSACEKNSGGEPMLFYKLIIHLREENN